jgi:hypothetical protein
MVRSHTPPDRKQILCRVMHPNHGDVKMDVLTADAR